MRNLKAFALAAVAALAMSAMAASAASAESPFEFHSSVTEGDTILSGSQIGSGDVFTTDAGSIECAEAVYSGSESENPTNEITLTPEYDQCTHSLGSAVVDENSCSYVFTANTFTGSGEYDVDTAIECSDPEDSITVTVSAFGTLKCTVHIPEQDLGAGIVLTNENGKSDIVAHVGFDNIKYSETTGSGFGACSETSGTENGEYTGEATIEGEDQSENAADIWVE